MANYKSFIDPLFKMIDIHPSNHNHKIISVITPTQISDNHKIKRYVNSDKFQELYLLVNELCFEKKYAKIIKTYIDKK